MGDDGELETVLSALTEGYGTLLYAESRTDQLCSDLKAIRDAYPDLPVVALLDQGAVGPRAVLDAGVAEVVETRGTPDDWVALLEHQLDSVTSGGTRREPPDWLSESVAEMGSQSEKVTDL